MKYAGAERRVKKKSGVERRATVAGERERMSERERRKEKRRERERERVPVTARTTAMDPSCPGRNFLRSHLGRAREPRGAIKLMVTRAGNSLRSVCRKSTTWPLRLVIYRGRILRPMSADDDNDDGGWCFLAFVAVGGNTVELG